jgi:hypothetical protein
VEMPEATYLNTRRRFALVWVSLFVGLIILGVGMTIAALVHPAFGNLITGLGFLVAVIPGAVMTWADFSTQKALKERVERAMPPADEHSSHDL